MLNTNQVKPHLNEYWCIPKENDASFVANTEYVSGIYKRAYNPEIPVICMVEEPVQLSDEIRDRISAKSLHIDADTGLPKPGRIEKTDSEYVRCGTAGIFMFTEPLGDRRHVTALKNRKKGNFTCMMRYIAETDYPDVKKVVMS